MLTRILAAAAFATLSVAAQAGTLQNGTWTTTCTPPGDVPPISDKSPEAYNKSAKALQGWQTTAQEFQTCLQAQAKGDSDVIVSTANAALTKLSDDSKAMVAANDAALAKLKSASKKAQ